MPPYRLSPTTLPTPALQAIQDSVFAHATGPYGGYTGPTSGPGWQGMPFGQAIINHLTKATGDVTNSGWPGGWHPGWWRNPGGGPTGPPVQPPDPNPIGFPNLQALIEYMQGRYPGIY
jgi:hypothetical protein